MFNGDRHVQAVEVAAPEQRPCVLLPLPNPPRTQVYPLRQCTTSGSQA